MRRIMFLLTTIAVIFSGVALASDTAQRLSAPVQVSMVFNPSPARSMQSPMASQVHKAFCGQCSDHSHCGPGNRCCRSGCPAGKRTCVNSVATCP